ncbi:AraC family transcriptional regulator N-terminal domain-containing protein [Rhodoferax sp.]|uniref:AraC family transcriptional regulator n=1 Tax=Rhodoferax sp. TaxID=50421 RepID=UPI00374CA861
MPKPPDPYAEIAALITRHTAVDGEFSTAIGGLFFSRRSSPTQALHTAQWPCFALVAQGAKSLTLGEQVFHYGVGDYLLMSLDLPVASRVTQASTRAPNLGLGLAIDPLRLADLLRRVPIPRPPSAADGMRSVAVNAAPPELLDASLRLLRLLDTPADIAALAPLIEEEILYRLLTGPDGARLLYIASAESRSNRVGKAVDWLRGNFAKPLRIPELAEHVGMSESSLHHHFKAVTALTPVQYQK